MTVAVRRRLDARLRMEEKRLGVRRIYRQTWVEALVVRELDRLDRRDERERRESESTVEVAADGNST